MPFEERTEVNSANETEGEKKPKTTRQIRTEADDRGVTETLEGRASLGLLCVLRAWHIVNCSVSVAFPEGSGVDSTQIYRARRQAQHRLDLVTGRPVTWERVLSGENAEGEPPDVCGSCGRPAPGRLGQG